MTQPLEAAAVGDVLERLLLFLLQVLFQGVEFANLLLFLLLKFEELFLFLFLDARNVNQE